VTALFAAAVSLFLLGVIDQVSSLIDPVNPLHVLTIVGPDLNDRIRTAGLLAVPLAFGVSLTATSVQTYINRRVPIPLQGRTFALQGSLRNGASIIPLLALGVAASHFGAGTVLLFSPLLLLAVGYSMVAISFRISGLRVPSRLQVMESF
jgi:hypothetical protein